MNYAEAKAELERLSRLHGQLTQQDLAGNRCAVMSAQVNCYDVPISKTLEDALRTACAADVAARKTLLEIRIEEADKLFEDLDR